MSKPDFMGPTPSPFLEGVKEYSVSSLKDTIDLKLNSNEGSSPPFSLLEILKNQPLHLMSRYKKADKIELQIAKRLNIAPERVFVTAGGDDAIDRICRAFIPPNREMILPFPTFEMIQTFGVISGANIVKVPWKEKC